MRSTLLVALSAGVGAVVALAANSAPHQQQVQAPAKAASPATRPVQIARLSSARTSASFPKDMEPSSTGGDHKERAANQDDTEEALESEDAWRQTLFAWHHESAQSAWSEDASRAMEGDLQSLRESMENDEQTPFDVDSLSCRGGVCIANLLWESSKNAHDRVEQIAMHSYEKNCEIVVFSPESESRGYLQEVVLDCRDHL